MEKRKQYTGKDIGIAVLDTGTFQHIDFDHRIIYFKDFVHNRINLYDDNGHGTHVTGIIAGNGKASNGIYKGAAPESHIISLKVLDRFGNGKQTYTIQALDWILKYHMQYNIRIVNISVGSIEKEQIHYDRLIKKVEEVWDEGLIVVTAAGNAGPNPGTITVPGISKKVITVGASDMLNNSHMRSGQGPTHECVCKPDIVYKGNQIISCKVSADGKSYVKKSGTSMATPYISGSIALALEKDPLLTNRDIKMMIRNCAKDMGLPHNQQGWGEFDLKCFMNF